MRIAFLLSHFPVISESFILSQITGLLMRGHDVTIFADSPRSEGVVHADINQFNLLNKTHYCRTIKGNFLARLICSIWLIIKCFFKAPLKMLGALNIFMLGRKIFSSSYIGRISTFIDHDSFDIIHCHFGPNGLIGNLSRNAGVLRGKIITTFHGCDVNKYPKTHGLDIYKELFQEADLFTVNTDYTGKIVEGLGCPPNKIRKLPVGLDMKKFFYKERKLGDNKIVTIATVARLVPKKGLEYALEAIKMVLSRHTNIRYLIAGNGFLYEKLEALINDYKINDNVKLLGWLNSEEISELYDKSHFFLLPSVTSPDGDKEGQGLVLQEAQAMGLPVVSTLHNGIPEGVLDGKSGFLVPEKDVKALADKVSYLIENPQIWPQMGRSGRDFVEERYDIEKLNGQLVELYRSIL